MKKERKRRRAREAFGFAKSKHLSPRQTLKKARGRKGDSAC
jgi:hypothetical protein